MLGRPFQWSGAASRRRSSRQSTRLAHGGSMRRFQSKGASGPASRMLLVLLDTKSAPAARLGVQERNLFAKTHETPDIFPPSEVHRNPVAT